MRPRPEGYPQTKWDAVNVALRDVFGSFRGILSLGLELFPAGDVPLECGTLGDCCDMPTGSAMDVTVALGSASIGHVYNALGTCEPGGGTPTAEALRRALAYFSSGEGSSLAGDRYVVLVTDGGPNCNAGIECITTHCTLNIDGVTGCPQDSLLEADNCCHLNTQGCLDSEATLAAIEQLSDSGVGTFVVGIPGSESYAEQLTSFARAGGQAAMGADGTETYYAAPAVGGVAEMIEVFGEITTRVVSPCAVQLETAPEATNEINVAVDCTIVPRVLDSVESGWRLDESNSSPTVMLTGDRCNQIVGPGVERIDIIMGCTSIY